MEYLFPNTPGQENAKQQFIRALENKKLPHAYLLQGACTSCLFPFALDLAMLLLCKNEKNRPCSDCPDCNKIANHAHPNFQIYHPFPSMEALKMEEEEYWEYMRNKISDLIQYPYQKLLFEKEAHLSIHLMRHLQQNLANAGVKGAQRIFVICEADRLGEEAANSILKILEEPPIGTLFLILTARPFLLLPTIISRCQIMRLGSLTPREILSYLKSARPDYSLNQLQNVSALAGGELGKALELLEGEMTETIDFARSFIQVCEQGDLKDAFALADEISSQKDTGLLRGILQIVLNHVRESCILETGKIFPDPISLKRADRYIKTVKQILDGVEGNAMPYLLLFTQIRNLQKERVNVP